RDHPGRLSQGGRNAAWPHGAGLDRSRQEDGRARPRGGPAAAHRRGARGRRRDASRGPYEGRARDAQLDRRLSPPGFRKARGDRGGVPGPAEHDRISPSPLRERGVSTPRPLSVLLIMVIKSINWTYIDEV